MNISIPSKKEITTKFSIIDDKTIKGEHFKLLLNESYQHKTIQCLIDPFKIKFKYEYRPKTQPKKHLIKYDIIKLKSKKLEEIIADNLIISFFISGISSNSKQIENSIHYKSICSHKECEEQLSWTPNVLFSFEKKKQKIKPNEGTAMLVFPTGIKLCINDSNNNKEYQNEIRFNVMTDVSGLRYYLYSIVFYLKFKKEEVPIYFDKIDIIDKCNSDVVSIPFAFTLISSHSSLKSFEPILKDLFFLYKTKLYNTDDFDNELVHLIYEVPSPLPNSSYMIFLPYFNTAIKSHIQGGKLHNDYHHILKKTIFSKLSVKSIISIFVCLLTEKMMIFLSESSNDLIVIIESFLSLIYPIKWASTYIPILSQDSLQYIQSFIPFVMGITYEVYNNIGEYKNTSNDLCIIDIDKDTIILKNNKNIEEYFPIYDRMCHSLNKYQEMSSIEIYEIFLSSMIELIGSYQLYTSIVGESNLFNQTCFVQSKESQYHSFYTELTSTQQFLMFIQNCDDSEYNDFNSRCKGSLSTSENIDNYVLYPYFFPIDKETSENISKSINMYYSSMTKSKKISYYMTTEAYIRFSLIMKNYIPTQLKRYIFFSTYLLDNTNTSFDISFNNSENTQNSNKSSNDGLHRAAKVETPRAPYRKQSSLINMVMEDKKGEISQYKDQLYEILHDFMGYIFVNSAPIKISIGDFSHFFVNTFIRKEFAFVMYQDKFNNNILHELTAKSFEDLEKVSMYCLINSKDEKEEYETIRLVTKSLFFYFKYIENNKKEFLIHSISKHQVVFEIWKDRAFWKYWYTEDGIQNPLENVKDKLIGYMKDLNINDKFVVYCRTNIFI